MHGGGVWTWSATFICVPSVLGWGICRRPGWRTRAAASSAEGVRARVGLSRGRVTAVIPEPAAGGRGRARAASCDNGGVRHLASDHWTGLASFRRYTWWSLTGTTAFVLIVLLGRRILTAALPVWAAYAVSTFGTFFAFDAFPLIAILVLDAGPAAVSALASAGLAPGALLPILVVLSWRRLVAIDRSATIPTDELAALQAVPMLAPLPLVAKEEIALRLVPTPGSTMATLRPPT